MRRLGTSAALLFAFAIGACNALLGIEEASELPGDASVSGGSGGAGGATGGTSGSGGSSGTDASTGGIAGATGGTAGAAGGGGSSPCIDTQNDQKNCGWCGHDCGTAPCQNGYCKPEELSVVDWGWDMVQTADAFFIAGGIDDKFIKLNKQTKFLESWNAADGVYAVALHENYVYFGEDTSHGLWRTPITALSPTKILTAADNIQGIAADASGLYYSEYGEQNVRRANLDGSGASDFVTNIFNAWYLVADSTDLYIGAVNDGIFKVSKTASAPLDGNTLPYFYDISGEGPSVVALDEDSVFFATGDPSGTFPLSSATILRVKKDKSGTSTVATSSTLVFDIVSDGGFAYWVEEGTLQNDYGDGAVRRIELDNAAAVIQTYSVTVRAPLAIATDGNWVYWLNGGWTSLPGSVVRVRR